MADKATLDEKRKQIEDLKRQILDEKRKQADELQRQIREEEERIAREGWQEVAQKLSDAFDNVEVEFHCTPDEIRDYHDCALQYGRGRGTDTVFRFVWKDRLVKYGRYKTKYGFTTWNEWIIFPGKEEIDLPTDKSEALFAIGGKSFRDAADRVQLAKNQKLFSDEQLHLMYMFGEHDHYTPDRMLRVIRWYNKPKHGDDLAKDAVSHDWKRLTLKQTVADDAE